MEINFHLISGAMIGFELLNLPQRTYLVFDLLIVRITLGFGNTGLDYNEPKAN